MQAKGVGALSIHARVCVLQATAQRPRKVGGISQFTLSSNGILWIHVGPPFPTLHKYQVSVKSSHVFPHLANLWVVG